MIVYVITATVGTEHLQKCVESVEAQDYSEIEHIVVCDGVQYEDKVRDFCSFSKRVKLLTLPWNTGRDRYICHKIYAAIPHLLHGPGYVMFLDEDNWLEPGHVRSLVHCLEENRYDWVFSLRNICHKDGSFLCRDECESLGNIAPTCLGEDDRLVDTSCYLIPIEIVRQFSECWQRRAREHPEADRLFYHHLAKHYPHFSSTHLYTLNYRLEGRPDSVTAEFFLHGNNLRSLNK